MDGKGPETMSSKLDSTRFSDGQPIAKADLRDAFDTTRQELEHGGFTAPAGPDHPPRRVSDRLGEILSVKDFGAVGDGKTDDSAAFQAAIDTGREIRVPRGTYRIETALKIGDRGCYLIGEVTRAFNDMPHILYVPRNAGTDEPLLRKIDGYLDKDGNYTFYPDNWDGYAKFEHACSVVLKNLELMVGHKHGSLVDLHETKHNYFEGCFFRASGRCLTLGSQSFDNTIINCEFQGMGIQKDYDLTSKETNDYTQLIDRCWGVYVSGHSYIYGCNFKGNGVGVRLEGVANVLCGGRFEVCALGIAVGKGVFKPQGYTGWMSEGNFISGISMEGNVDSILIQSTTALHLSNFRMQCYQHPQIPTQGVGLHIKGMSSVCKVENGAIGGQCSPACIVNETRFAIHNVNVGSSSLHIGDSMQPFLGYHDKTDEFYTLIDTPMNGWTGSAFSHLMLRGLNGLNVTNPVFARNLGGTVEPSSGAASVDVAFQKSYGGTELALNDGECEAIAEPVSTLPRGEYIYWHTTVFPHCETQAGDATITVESGEAVKIQWYGGQKGPIKRVYRQQSDGTFDGYWEITDRSNSFVDDGNKPFDGVGIPPRVNGRPMPTRHEDDANYQIVVQPSWHTTTIVTNKATSGFTIEFGTPPPDAEQSVTWLLFRP